MFQGLAEKVELLQDLGNLRLRSDLPFQKIEISELLSFCPLPVLGTFQFSFRIIPRRRCNATNIISKLMSSGSLFNYLFLFPQNYNYVSFLSSSWRPLTCSFGNLDRIFFDKFAELQEFILHFSTSNSEDFCR